MQLGQLLTTDNILLDQPLIDADAVLGRLAGHYADRLVDRDSDQLHQLLRKRERTGSTALGAGVAIPHARLASDFSPRALFLRSSTPVPFEAPDGHPVDLFFSLLVPEHATDQHLEWLSEIAELCSNDSACAALRAARTPQQIRAVLVDYLGRDGHS